MTPAGGRAGSGSEGGSDGADAGGGPDAGEDLGPLDAAAVARLRAETPGAADHVHLNNAGAALLPASVDRVVRAHLDLELRLGGYEAEDAAAEAIGGVYAALAALLSTEPAQIALVEHATGGFVQALSSVRWKRGDALVTTRHDYVSNQIQYLALAERFGVEVLRAPDAPEGGVDPAALEELVHRRRPRLVAVTHVPTSSGLVQDVEAIGQICRARDVLYLVDACQSVGQMPVDPDAIGADFLSGTGRKFLRGPRGTGFLWVSQRALDAGLEPLFPDLRGADWIADDLYQPAPDARRFETWEFNWAAVLGLGEAARVATALGASAVQARAGGLAADLRRRLSAIPRVRVLDRGPRLCAIVTAHLEGWEPGAAVRALRERGVHASALTRLSAVLDFETKGVEGAVRFSPHAFNTREELETAAGAVAELVERRVADAPRS